MKRATKTPSRSARRRARRLGMLLGSLWTLTTLAVGVGGTLAIGRWCAQRESAPRDAQLTAYRHALDACQREIAVHATQPHRPAVELVRRGARVVHVVR